LRWPEEGDMSTQAHQGKVTSCAASPEGTFFVSASEDNTLKVWDAKSGQDMATLAGHPDEVSHCAVGPDGTVYSLGPVGIVDVAVKAWQPAAGTELWGRLLTNVGEPKGLDVDPAGRFVAVLGSVGYLQLRDTASGDRLRIILADEGGGGNCAVSPDGAFVLGGALGVFDPASGERIRSLKPRKRNFALTPDGMEIVFVQREAGVEIANLATGASRPLGDVQWISSPAISPDGTLLASIEWESGVRVRRLASGELVHELSLATPEQRDLFSAGRDPGVMLAFTADGTAVISADGDGTLKIWEVASGEELGEVPLGTGLTCLAVHSSRAIAACGDEVGGFHVLDLGFELAPLVVTAVDRGSGPAVRCPVCLEVFPHGEGSAERTCPNANCATPLRINPFVLTFPTEPLPREEASPYEGDPHGPGERDAEVLAADPAALEQPTAAPAADDSEAFTRMYMENPEAAKQYFAERLAALPPPSNPDEERAMEFMRQTLEDMDKPAEPFSMERLQAWASGGEEEKPRRGLFRRRRRK
jgi:WD40 repeat protein